MPELSKKDEKAMNDMAMAAGIVIGAVLSIPASMLVAWLFETYGNIL